MHRFPMYILYHGYLCLSRGLGNFFAFAKQTFHSPKANVVEKSTCDMERTPPSKLGCKLLPLSLALFFPCNLLCLLAHQPGAKRKGPPCGSALSLWCRWWDSEPRRASSAASCSRSPSPSSFPATCCAFSPINRHKAKGRTPRVRPFTLVPVVGLEPTRCRHQRILSPSRLPIPSHRLILFATDILYHIRRKKSSPNLRFFCGFAKISQHFQSS